MLPISREPIFGSRISESRIAWSLHEPRSPSSLIASATDSPKRTRTRAFFAERAETEMRSPPWSSRPKSSRTAGAAPFVAAPAFASTQLASLARSPTQLASGTCRSFGFSRFSARDTPDADVHTTRVGATSSRPNGGSAADARAANAAATV